MDMFTDIYETLGEEQLYKLIIPLTITLIIAAVTIGTTLFFSRKSSLHQKNSLQLGRLQLLKNLIDKRAYKLLEYRLVVEETMKSYIGYEMNFKLIQTLLKTKSPSRNLYFHKRGRFNLKITNEENQIIYSQKYSIFRFTIQSLGLFLVFLILCASLAILGFAAFERIIQTKTNVESLMLSIMIFIFSTISIAFFLLSIQTLNRGIDTLCDQHRFKEYLDELNNASKLL